jgi:hypothetical protein
VEGLTNVKTSDSAKIKFVMPSKSMSFSAVQSTARDPKGFYFQSIFLDRDLPLAAVLELPNDKLAVVRQEIESTKQGIEDQLERTSPDGPDYSEWRHRARAKLQKISVILEAANQEQIRRNAGPHVLKDGEPSESDKDKNGYYWLGSVDPEDPHSLFTWNYSRTALQGDTHWMPHNAIDFPGKP